MSKEKITEEELLAIKTAQQQAKEAKDQAEKISLLAQNSVLASENLLLKLYRKYDIKDGKDTIKTDGEIVRTVEVNSPFKSGDMVEAYGKSYKIANIIPDKYGAIKYHMDDGIHIFLTHELKLLEKYSGAEEKCPFDIGDKVYHYRDNSRELAVIKGFDFSVNHALVHYDGKDHDNYINISDLKLDEPISKCPFKIGDKVKVITKNRGTIGKIGTFKGVHQCFPVIDEVWVDFEGKSYHYHDRYKSTDLELYKEEKE